MQRAHQPHARPGASSARALRVAHVPFEAANPYQRRLLEELRRLGYVTIEDRLRSSLVRYARSIWRADILHVHWVSAWHFGRNPGGLLRRERFFFNVRVLRSLGVRVVWTIHNLGHHEGTPAAERAFLRRMFKAADACIVHSQSAREAVLGAVGPAGARLAAKLHLVPHGNYDGCYPTPEARAETRRRLGVPQSAFMPAFLGLIRPYKNVGGLIEAFRSAELPGARLLVCGKPNSAELLDELSRAVGGAPEVVGRFEYLSEQECADMLEASDAVVLPYLEVLTSGAALLALTFGRPIIAPRRGCFAELAGDDAGILYDPTRPDGLREALREAARDPQRLAAMGRAARAKADSLAWSSIAEMHRRIYESPLR